MIATWSVLITIALFFVNPAGVAAVGRRFRGGRPGGGNGGVVARGASPAAADHGKPPLRLTFQMPMGNSAGDSQLLSADASRLAIAVRDASPVLANETHLPRDGSILDFALGRRFMQQRFFDELVCYRVDLDDGSAPGDESSAAPAGAPRNETTSRRSFLDALGQALGASLELYDNARRTGKTQQVAGLNCSVFVARRVERRSMAELAAMTGGGQPVVGPQGRGLLPSLKDILRAARDGPTAPSIGDAEVAENASFCVTGSGALLAVNSSRRVAVEVTPDDNASAPVVWTLFKGRSRSFALAPPDHAPHPSLFDGSHGVAGGGCVDLTRGSVGPTELKANLNDEERLRRINVEAGGHWQASAYDLWKGITVGEVVQSLGTEIAPLRLPRLPSWGLEGGPSGGFSFRTEEVVDIPGDFNARHKWPNCTSIGMIRNQGMCGSCWAFAAAAVLADRFCIAGAGTGRHSDRDGSVGLLQEQTLQGLSLAPERLIDCDSKNNGCQGGRLDDAWWYLRDHGVPSETCAPYRFCPIPTEPRCAYSREGLIAELKAAGPPSCRASCAGGAPLQFYRAADAYAAAAPADVAALQRELMTRGPVEVGFFVFSDFHSYRYGVYFRTPGAYGPLGGHAVRLLGWGTSKSRRSKDLDYWEAANSWSPNWGLGGFFRIRRGTNECGIESTPAAGVPQMDLAGAGGTAAAAGAAAVA